MRRYHGPFREAAISCPKSNGIWRRNPPAPFLLSANRQTVRQSRIRYSNFFLKNIAPPSA